jgi:hypothetical protein
MKLWSRGLGKTELKMDFRYYRIKKDPESDNVFIVGRITDPVDWEFKITIDPEDIPGMAKIFFNSGVIKLLIKNLHKYIIYLFNRKKYIEKAGHDIEEKVNAAYAGMMKGRERPSLKRTEGDSYKQQMQAVTLN